MAKIIGGFVLGVLSTLLVLSWLDKSEKEGGGAVVPRQVSQPVIQPAQAPVPIDKIAAPAAAAGKADTRDSEPVTPVAMLPEQDSLTTNPAVASPDPAPEPAIPRPDPDTSINTNDSQYPPEIADMIENAVKKELQQRYENDPREDSWATYMEGMLAAYFAQKPGLQQFNISLIDCRTSICAVHVLGYGNDPLTQWNAATADMVAQPWFDFTSMSMNRRNPAPGVLAVVLILTKKTQT